MIQTVPTSERSRSATIREQGMFMLVYQASRFITLHFQVSAEDARNGAPHD
ncbi:hypothetical protein PCH70_49300 [Pseudomonas cichorii JBC1]|nr:hypothetical protein PCH70_49300 [Pseudomonas cichorii JBC1]